MSFCLKVITNISRDYSYIIFSPKVVEKTAWKYSIGAIKSKVVKDKIDKIISVHCTWGQSYLSTVNNKRQLSIV